MVLQALISEFYQRAQSVLLRYALLGRPGLVLRRFDAHQPADSALAGRLHYPPRGVEYNGKSVAIDRTAIAVSSGALNGHIVLDRSANLPVEDDRMTSSLKIIACTAILVGCGVSTAAGAVVKLSGRVGNQASSSQLSEFSLLVHYSDVATEPCAITALAVSGAFTEVEYDHEQRLLTLGGGRSGITGAKLLLEQQLPAAESELLAAFAAPLRLQGTGFGDSGTLDLMGSLNPGSLLRAPEPSSVGILAALVAGCGLYALRARSRMPAARLTAA
jgi:hypothetical protein